MSHWGRAVTAAIGAQCCSCALPPLFFKSLFTDSTALSSGVDDFVIWVHTWYIFSACQLAPLLSPLQEKSQQTLTVCHLQGGVTVAERISPHSPHVPIPLARQSHSISQLRHPQHHRSPTARTRLLLATVGSINYKLLINFPSPTEGLMMQQGVTLGSAGLCCPSSAGVHQGVFSWGAAPRHCCALGSILQPYRSVGICMEPRTTWCFGEGETEAQSCDGSVTQSPGAVSYPQGKVERQLPAPLLLCPACFVLC